MTDIPTSGGRPGRKSDQFIVRFPDGMRDRIAEAAKAAGRSMNAEIIHRLEASFSLLESEGTSFAKPLSQAVLQQMMDRAFDRLEERIARGDLPYPPALKPIPSDPAAPATLPSFADTMANALDSLPAKSAEVQSDMAELGAVPPAEPTPNPQPELLEAPPKRPITGGKPRSRKSGSDD